MGSVCAKNSKAHFRITQDGKEPKRHSLLHEPCGLGNLVLQLVLQLVQGSVRKDQEGSADDPESNIRS